MAKLTVAIDLDEVMGKYLHHYIEFHNHKFNTSFKQSQFNTYVFYDITGDSPEQMQKNIEEFHKSPYFEDVSVVSGALESLKELRDCGVDFQVVTSRQNSIETITKRWVQKHFPDIFSAVHVMNHFGGEGPVGIPKFKKCEEINAPILIDDSLANCMEMANSGKRALLLDINGEYGWNQAASLPDAAQRIRSWADVVPVVKAFLAETS